MILWLAKWKSITCTMAQVIYGVVHKVLLPKWLTCSPLTSTSTAKDVRCVVVHVTLFLLSKLVVIPADDQLLQWTIYECKLKYFLYRFLQSILIHTHFSTNGLSSKLNYYTCNIILCCVLAFTKSKILGNSRLQVWLYMVWSTIDHWSLLF